jgi:hypothetical protein
VTEAAQLAQIVDVDALLSVVAASLAAGAGLTIAFSVTVVCATRAAELRRAGSRVWATVLSALAVAAVLLCVALVALGLRIMVE